MKRNGSSTPTETSSKLMTRKRLKKSSKPKNKIVVLVLAPLAHF